MRETRGPVSPDISIELDLSTKTPQRRKLDLHILESFDPVILQFLEKNADTIHQILDNLKPSVILPQEFKEEARRELTQARETMGMAEVMIERGDLEDKEEWKIKMQDGVNSRNFASDRIGFSKIAERKPIYDPPVEWKARARTVSLMIVLRRGIVVDRKALEKIIEEADKEHLDLSGKDTELVNRILQLFPKREKTKNRVAVKKALRFSDEETKASYKAQDNVGAKLEAVAYTKVNNHSQ